MGALSGWLRLRVFESNVPWPHEGSASLPRLRGPEVGNQRSGQFSNWRGLQDRQVDPLALQMRKPLQRGTGMVPRPTASHSPQRGPVCWVRKREKASSAWNRGLVRLDPVVLGFICCRRSDNYEGSV